LRVLSGRLKAVLVASLATIVLVGILAPTTTLASDPPGLARFMYALGQVESHGDYSARNESSGAYGKYQIMPASWRAWAGRYLGDPKAKPSPANQEIVATAKVKALYKGLQSWRRVAHWWLTGSSATNGWSPFATRYVSRVMNYYKRAPDKTIAPAPTASPTPKLTTVAKVKAKAVIHRVSEESRAIAYTGTWRQAGHRGYIGDQVRYATSAGASARFTFTGSRVVWYGPVGPTRGKAKISIDGASVTTVDLYRRSFDPHEVLFSKSWKTAGKHTLVIQVVGTPGRPYVAIDGFGVVN
jgi:transglycosylase-like protein